MSKCLHALPAFISRYKQFDWKRRVTLCSILAETVFAPFAAALDLTTEENVPFNYRDGQRITGISTEILLEMGRRAGIPMNIRILPWARAYQSALKYPETCVFSTVRLPERETLFKWIGPLASNKWALFAKSDFNDAIHTIDDARNYRIGGVILDAKALYLQSLGFNNIDLVADDNLNFAKLIAGRIDLWISGLYRDREPTLHSGNMTIKPVLVVREVDYFLACNPKTAGSTLRALKQALQSLQKEGYVRNVAQRYAEQKR